MKRKTATHICADCGVNYSCRSDYNPPDGTRRCRPCSNINRGRVQSTHGLNNTNSRLHVTWSNMKRRCLNPTKKEIRNYSGVYLHEDWYLFQGFMDWALANGYDDKKTIDRKDYKKGYTPENCRFVDYNTQSANRRKTDKNTSGYIGVYLNKRSMKWAAKVQWRKNQIHLGLHEKRKQAALSRDRYILENNLPHTLNFPKAKIKELEK